MYHIAEDPYEWDNLAADPAHRGKLEELRGLGPKKFAEKIPPSMKALGSLKWRPAAKGAAPPSKPDGATFGVVFINRTEQPVELFWMDRQGKPKSYGIIGVGKKREQSTRPGAVWQIAEPETGGALGHFIVGDRRAKAVIPAKQ